MSEWSESINHLAKHPCRLVSIEFLEDVQRQILTAYGMSPTWQKLQDVIGQGYSEGGYRIMLERQRQVWVKGYTGDHDADHSGGELLLAADSYLHHVYWSGLSPKAPSSWPWNEGYWKPSDNPVRNLEKTGALIAAEIDRIKAGQ